MLLFFITTCLICNVLVQSSPITPASFLQDHPEGHLSARGFHPKRDENPTRIHLDTNSGANLAKRAPTRVHVQTIDGDLASDPTAPPINGKFRLAKRAVYPGLVGDDANADRRIFLVDTSITSITTQVSATPTSLTDRTESAGLLNLLGLVSSTPYGCRTFFCK